ncbi:hypothetical protein [Salinicola peritrichatus]|uniref:hypothetical protein n=1 Tax=Salinicola peritrichatus TaxID=1267424 RepID=UPI001EF8D8D2|nr:hypothetical protein [Salinicola peritrichatus]
MRRIQLRESTLWSLTLLALYLGSTHFSEFDLATLWNAIPHFFDYILKTLPILHLTDLFANVHTEGSLAY